MNAAATESAAGAGPRVATQDDAAALVSLVQSAYRGEQSKVGWTSEADLLDDVRIDLPQLRALIAAADAGVVLLIEQDDRPVACCQLARLPADRAYFGMFAVQPHRQGAGLGRRLLAAAEDHARSWGCTELEMTVIAVRQELIAWYVRRGYCDTGERRPFLGTPRPQAPPLEFVVLAKNLGRSGDGSRPGTTGVVSRSDHG